jgi:hypothetical protein
MGAERYSSYAGYGDTYQFAGDYVDLTPRYNNLNGAYVVRDMLGRKKTIIVAMVTFSSP